VGEMTLSTDSMMVVQVVRVVRVDPGSEVVVARRKGRAEG
jgi:hypothetical protein